MATLASMFNQELSYVSSCLNANKLTVHHDRSKFIIPHTRRKQVNPLELNIFINHTPIAQVQKRKFLRIIIHENLSWKPHITTVCDKVTKGIGIFSKSRRYLPLVTLKTLCNYVLLPYINYCNLIWLSTYASYLKPLHLLQKIAIRLIRIITFSPPQTRSKPLFSKLNILSFHSLYEFHVSCFIFSHFDGLLPSFLFSLVHLNRDFPDYLFQLT